MTAWLEDNRSNVCVANDTIDKISLGLASFLLLLAVQLILSLFEIHFDPLFGNLIHQVNFDQTNQQDNPIQIIYFCFQFSLNKTFLFGQIKGIFHFYQSLLILVDLSDCLYELSIHDTKIFNLLTIF